MVSQQTRWRSVCVGLLLLVPFFALPAQPLGWEWLNPKPTGNSMYDVQMVTEQFGVAVGENGGTIMTYDAGRTWNIGSANTKAQLHAVHFRDSLNGVVGGSALTVMQTTDGGATWQQRSRGTEDVESVWDITMITPMLGVAVGGTNLTAIILRTVDGGKTWDNVPSPVENPLYAMHFINAREGWAVGAWNTVIHTSDGGATWTLRRTEGSGSAGGRRPELRGVFFFDSLNGFTAGRTGQFKEQGPLYSTTDGGYTWSGSLRNFGMSPGRVVFITNTTGYLLGSGIIYRTIDGGKQWSALYGADLSEITLFQGIGVNGSTIAAVGSPARIHSSNDTGVTWHIRSSGSAATFSGVAFSARQQGVAVAVAVGRDFKADPTSQITIYTTTNSGKNWEKRPYPGQQILTNVACRDGLCVAVGDSGTILRSVDDGVTWTECVSGVKNYLNDVVVINRSNAVAVGRNATVIRTTD
ncbi:MAG: hypothetical protein IT211_07920, partial [Armatimonadetes bacterium]|nr:hypothetical protein [Armatimonadota bacterium]